MRLDNIVYRAGIAPTVPAARQLVNHGHIAVNKRVVDIPSYRCQIKDQICIRNGSKINSYKNLSESYNKTLKLPYHLTMTAENASINNIVDRKSVGLKVNELLIVEYYSRQA
jgi:small subunit ribosomal protein S4